MAEPDPDAGLNDDRATVLALLRLHGLAPAAKEIDALVAALPRSRQIMQLLAAMPGVRYEEPAVAFEPRLAAP